MTPRYYVREWDWPLRIPCPWAIWDTETSGYVLRERGTMARFRTAHAAQREVDRMNRASNRYRT